MRGMSSSQHAPKLLPVLAGFALGMCVVTACAHTDNVPDAPAGSASADNSQCAAADLERTLMSAPSAPVIVLLQANADGAPAQQAKLLQELGADFQLARIYSGVPGFAGNITRRGYERARAHRAVRCIQLDHPGTGGG